VQRSAGTAMIDVNSSWANWPRDVFPIQRKSNLNSTISAMLNSTIHEWAGFEIILGLMEQPKDGIIHKN
jgi:hypothetical protein